MRLFNIKSKIDPIVVATAHKVGSTWVHNILRNSLSLVKPEIEVEYRNNPRNPGTINLSKTGSLDWILNHNNAIFKSHSFPIKDQHHANVIFVTVIRDPRDLMISSIFYLSHLDPVKLDTLIERIDP